MRGFLQPLRNIRQVAPFVSGAVEAGGKPVDGETGEHPQGLDFKHLRTTVLQQEEKQEGGVEEVDCLVFLLNKGGGL